MNNKKIIIATSLLLFMFLPGNIWGQEEEEGPEGKSDITLFLGATSAAEATAFTIGADYQYRISRLFGVGALVDFAGGDFKSVLVAPAGVLHLKKFSFVLAPGLEFSDDETTMVLRVGALYEFELSRFSISPSVYYDTERAGEPSLVYGLSFSIKL